MIINRDKQINIRVTAAEKKLLQKAGKLNGLRESTYVRHVALKAAKRAVK